MELRHDLGEISQALQKLHKDPRNTAIGKNSLVLSYTCVLMHNV